MLVYQITIAPILAKLDEDYEDTITFILDNLLTDVEIRNGGFYLYLRGREELANFYCGSNNSDFHSITYAII